MLTEHKTLQIKSKKSRDLMLEEMKSIAQKISIIKSTFSKGLYVILLR